MQPKFIPLLIVYFSVLSMNIAYSDEKNEAPNLDFLIFLGTFEDSNGKWQDPMEIDQMLDQDDEIDRKDNNKQEASGDE